MSFAQKEKLNSAFFATLGHGSFATSPKSFFSVYLCHGFGFVELTPCETVTFYSKSTKEEFANDLRVKGPKLNFFKIHIKKKRIQRNSSRSLAITRSKLREKLCEFTCPASPK